MKIISISSNKGGVGKTTLTQNIGYSLASKGYKTLLIDLDSQESLSILYDVSPAYSIFNVLNEDIKIKDSITKITDNLDIITGSDNLDIEELWEDSLGGGKYLDPYLLKSYLQELSKDYDICLIDNAPKINSPSVINSLCCSDYVIIPINLDSLSVNTLLMELKTIKGLQAKKNKNLKIMGVVLNKYDKNNTLDTQIKDQFKEFKVCNVFNTTVRVSNAIRRSQALKRGIKEHNSRLPINEDIDKLTEEIINSLT